MPYCRDCGTEIYTRSTYCDSCEQDIIERSRDSIETASNSERKRMENDKNYLHSWLQSAIGWIVDLIKIIHKIWSGGCYVTSALVKHKGLDDNCEQMQKFRAFRQHYILDSNTQSRKFDLEEYNITGQILVNWISSRQDSNLIWKYVENYINQFVFLLNNESWEEAYTYFKERTLNLQKDIFIDKHKK